MDITEGLTLYEQTKDFRGASSIKEHLVEQVGRVYFYTNLGGRRTPFHKQTLLFTDKEASQNNRQLYASAQEIKDLLEAERLHYTLQAFFRAINGRKVPLVVLREVKRLLDPYDANETL